MTNNNIINTTNHYEFRTSLLRDEKTASELCYYDGYEVVVLHVIPKSDTCGGHRMYEVQVVKEPGVTFCAFEDELWKGEFYAKSQNNNAKSSTGDRSKSLQ